MLLYIMFIERIQKLNLRHVLIRHDIEIRELEGSEHIPEEEGITQDQKFHFVAVHDLTAQQDRIRSGQCVILFQ